MRDIMEGVEEDKKTVIEKAKEDKIAAEEEYGPGYGESVFADDVETGEDKKELPKRVRIAIETFP